MWEAEAGYLPTVWVEPYYRLPCDIHALFARGLIFRGGQLLEHLKAWAKAVKRDVIALWIAARDRRTPCLAKLLAALVAGYALSPIDLIPDFIPVLGYLDDVVILPLGIVAAVSLIPAALMAEFRVEAEKISARPKNRIAVAVIIAAWIGTTILAGWLVSRYLAA